MQRATLIQLLNLMEIAINPKIGGAAPTMLSDDPRRPMDQTSRDPDIPAGVFNAWLLQVDSRTINHNLDVVIDRYWHGGR